jgi:type IV pilus assembly protein PilN
MIKINLLDGYLGPATGDFDDSVMMDPSDVNREFVKRILMMFVIPVCLYLWESYFLPGLEEKVALKGKELSELEAFNSKAEGAVKEINKFKQVETNIQKRISFIEKISLDRLKEIQVFDMIQTNIPERVWLTRLEIVSNKVNISGLSVTDTDQSTFLESLSRSIYISEPQLLNSTEVKEGSDLLKKFTIGALLEREQ